MIKYCGMNSRNLTIDFARGFIVFIMPATHVTLYYSKLSVQQGPWGEFLRCFAEGAGAQVFMFLLGFSFFLGRKKSLQFVLKRSLAIFCLAYILNFLKFVVPSLFNMIPGSFFDYYQLQHGIFGIIDLLMTGDIFQLAAISYLICGVLYQLKQGWIVALILAFLITIGSPLLWGRRMDNFLIDYALKLFNGFPPAVFFPFFPWGVYPLLGFGLGWLFKYKPKIDFYRLCLMVGLGCIIMGILGIQFEPERYNASFYRLGPSGTFLHIGLVLLWLNACHFMAGKLKRKKPIVSIISWCSFNITIVYIFQWIIICWLFPLFGFMNLGLGSTLLTVALISLLTYVSVSGAKYYKRRLNKPGYASSVSP